MNYRTLYLRRSKKILRAKRRAAAVALLSVAACAAFIVYEPAPDLPPLAHIDTVAAPAPVQAQEARVFQAAAVENKAPRRVYPYSIVPGGVADRAELMRAVENDKVVAAHYASFAVEKAERTTVTKPRAVYVSYRKGDQVYWTAKKVMLAEGESLLSDGQNEIRGRCGNRISDVAMLPVEARGPSEAELDSSVEAPEDGPLNVSYDPDAEGAGRQSPQLLSFANGAGMLGVSGGDGWHGPAGAMASAGNGAYPRPYYGTGSTGGSAVSIGRPDPASTPNAMPTTTPVATPAATPSASATVGGSISETPRIAAVTTAATPTLVAAEPVVQTPSGATGLGPEAVELPVMLADTVQPEPVVDVKATTIPDNLRPQDLPATPAPSTTPMAEAPEPATVWLSGVGFAALLLLRRRRRA